MTKRSLNVYACALLLAVLQACVGDNIEIIDNRGDTDLMDFCVTVDGREYGAVDESTTDLTVFVPDGTDLKGLVARFRETPASVTVGGVEQVSGATANDFSGYRKGVVYTLTGPDGQQKSFTVRVMATRLPAVYVTTHGAAQINDRENWVDATLRLRNTDGSVERIGLTGIRGRGNWTWEKYPKKPYALKLEDSRPLLGMPAHKRWVLLAMYRGFIGNALAFEATRRAPALGWAPRGRYVELVLNGKFQGLYYLCEHIKIDPNRVDIAEPDSLAVDYPAISGGYLLEYDELYDEQYKFRTSGFKLPVQLKSPDDNVPDAQFNYIRGFINDMEAEILKIGTGQQSRYADYLDVDSFAEYWMVLETVNNYEAYKPRSVKMYKGRDGVDSPPGTVAKLHAGPLWDQELFMVDCEFNSMNMYYYRYLFKDPEFVRVVKERWGPYRDNLLGVSGQESFIDYLNGIFKEIEVSARRDISFWGNGYFTLYSEVATVRSGFLTKINWMDAQIEGM